LLAFFDASLPPPQPAVRTSDVAHMRTGTRQTDRSVALLPGLVEQLNMIASSSQMHVLGAQLQRHCEQPVLAYPVDPSSHPLLLLEPDYVACPRIENKFPFLCTGWKLKRYKTPCFFSCFQLPVGKCGVGYVRRYAILLSIRGLY